MSLSGEMIAFMMLALVAVIGGLLLLSLRKVVHMVIAVVFTFISIAGLYILLSAEFLAAVQILIYSGAITIMMLFGIMLTKHNDKEEERGNRIRKWFILLGIAGFAVTVYLGIYNFDIPSAATNLHVDNTKQIGIELFSKYAIPFELVSILLLVALIGAVILAKRDPEEEAEK
ncbi:NADH-quinone oxidoreductase subunit J [Bacillus massiliigorillae]|uniref:NADH-quinone oxidoreductase subunit J n=1 Tax=Bacillus massiliigorillae TaxID=1243664 RepID=UPI0003A9DF9B|nr:NADH-quinone oxidoreductase subunit J [Bacillus massiliigorillae]